MDVDGVMIEGELIQMLTHFVLEADDGAIHEVSIYEVDAFEIKGKNENACDEGTLQIPLSWINRLVVADLPYGTVCGMLSHLNLGEEKLVFLNALPGQPTIPPLPKGILKGMALVPKAVYVSWKTYEDQKFKVHRYFLQVMESIFVRELHTPLDLPFDDCVSFVLEDHEEEFRLVVGPVENIYHMKYINKQGCHYSFYCFPRPLCGEHITNASSDDFQLKWLAPGLPFGGEKQEYWVQCPSSESHASRQEDGSGIDREEE